MRRPTPGDLLDAAQSKKSGLNATFGCHEKISLRALDEVVWICTRIMQAASSRGDVTLPLSSGHTLRGKLHDYWNDKEKIRPVTTTFDLKSAYKQLPLSPAEQCKAIVTIKHPGHSEPAGYVCHTLPFGACGSVLHFNRVSALLRRVMLEMDILSSLRSSQESSTRKRGRHKVEGRLQCTELTGELDAQRQQECTTE